MTKSERIKYFDSIAAERKYWRKKGAYYHGELEKYLQFVIPPESSVIEIGCGTGELLASLKPKRGLGVDISPKMVELAQRQFPDLQFEVGDLENLQTEEKFDYVLAVETIGHVDDIQMAFKQLHKVCKPETRVVIVYYNYLWEPFLKLAQMMRLRMKQPLQHWLPLEHIANLLYLNDFEVIKKGYRCLMPFYVPLLSAFVNKFVANLPFFWKLSVNQILIARPLLKRKKPEDITCSVIIPCRNEKGNIEQAVLRTAGLGAKTEIIFVEGHSQDGTLEEC
ncbi:MAG: methyltransferase domain-containing protein, partial [Smithella sp.]|nr:methyltransferase domain-containing protein [Smithella sp.]